MMLKHVIKALANQSPVIRFYKMDDPSHPSWAVIDNNLWVAFQNLDASVSFYRNGVFDLPKNARWEWRIRVDHTDSVIDCKLTTTHAYVFAFDNLELGEDGNPHPKRAFRLKRAAWDRLIQKAFSALELDKFPFPLPLSAFGRVKISKGSPLRCVPKRHNNAPVLYLPEEQECFVSAPCFPIQNPQWSQIRLYSVTYWIETKYILDGEKRMTGVSA